MRPQQQSLLHPKKVRLMEFREVAAPKQKKRPPSRRIKVVIGAPLSDLITFEAANVWGKLFLRRKILYWIIFTVMVVVPMLSWFPIIKIFSGFNIM